MKLKYNFEIMEMDSEYMAVPLGDQSGQKRYMMRLNETGCEILKLLEKGEEIEDIVKTISYKYSDATLEEIEEAVKVFINKLQKHQVIE